MERNSFDHLGYSSDKIILTLIGEEIIYYSNKIYKYNSLSIKQERNLLLTNKCLYNFHNKKVKKYMKYINILGITFSNHSNELVIHALEGYDIHFISEEKIIIIYIIAKCYETLSNNSIIICQVNDKSLKQYVTPKKTKKKDAKKTKLDKKYAIDTRTFIADNTPKYNNKKKILFINNNNTIDVMNDIEEKENNNKTEFVFSSDDNIETIDVNDFDIKGIIGRGNLCKVFLSTCKKNNKNYAMKSIYKCNLEINKEIYSNLKNKLINLYYYFLNNVEFWFQSNEKIYFSFPYIQGELLYAHIKKEKNIDEKRIKFYSAIIALSIKYLHNYHISNINFSSKNIFIAKDGYLKLIPFHLVNVLPLKKDYYNKIIQKYKNEYTPPEIYLNLDINKKICDWWNLGILIYEMVYGITPFFSEVNNNLEKIIINDEIKFPNKKGISEECKDLMKKLLNKNYKERLGFINDFDDIRKHDFFKEINFNDLNNRKIESCYKPIVNDIQLEESKMNIFTYEDLHKNKIDFDS